jgi:hypothetical protein
MHMDAVGQRDRDREPAGGLVRQPDAARIDRETRGEPFQIPLERGGQGLVKIVQIENRRPLKGRKRAEIGQMAVAA